MKVTGGFIVDVVDNLTLRRAKESVGQNLAQLEPLRPCHETASDDDQAMDAHRGGIRWFPSSWAAVARYHQRHSLSKKCKLISQACTELEVR